MRHSSMATAFYLVVVRLSICSGIATGDSFEWQLCNLYFDENYCKENTGLGKNATGVVEVTTSEPLPKTVFESPFLQTSEKSAANFSLVNNERGHKGNETDFSPKNYESDSSQLSPKSMTDELPQETLLAKPTAVLPIVLVSPQKPQLATTRSGEPLGLLIPLTAVNGNSNFDSDIDPLKTPSVALPSIHKLLQNRQGTAQVNRDPPKEIVLAAARNEATKLRETGKKELAREMDQINRSQMSVLTNTDYMKFTRNQDPFDVQRKKPDFEFADISKLLEASSTGTNLTTPRKERADSEGLPKPTLKQTGPVSSDPANKLPVTSVRPDWGPLRKGPLNLTPISNSPANFIKKTSIPPAAPAPVKANVPDHVDCPVMKAEYDRICFVKPVPQAANATKRFCDAFKNNCKNLIKSLGGLIDPAARLEALQAGQIMGSKEEFAPSEDHESCLQLKPEYDDNCQGEVSPDVANETAAFCTAYVTMCKHLMETPQFGKYTEQATKFCERYMERCPKNQVPDEPVHFKKAKHIYIREFQYICTMMKSFASTYCIRPTVLKVMKYLILCGFYKQKCIDPYTSVVYA
ncbi:unnamed protein product [Enterobius vermicularis]|uniref:DUF19 domain-containing protein n=1 Tax=Enterobius vermicularis TaxID=51028 RepID=A0A0N4V281_ENTVE|nr:unnamed protein product [Enterobius vermicularis]